MYIETEHRKQAMQAKILESATTCPCCKGKMLPGEKFVWYVKQGEAAVTVSGNGTKTRYIPKHAFDCSAIMQLKNEISQINQEVVNLENMLAMIEAMPLDADKKEQGKKAFKDKIATCKARIQEKEAIIASVK